MNHLHSVLTDSKRKFRYDSRGNRTAMQGPDNAAYKYDALDRLIEVQKDGIRYEYRYDAFNRRIEKKVISQDEVHSTQYLYALENEIGAMQNNTIVELRVLGEGLGAEIGAAVTHELYGKTYVPIHDRQGNVSLLLDQNGNLAETYRYDAFGNETIYTDTPTHNPWRFSSKRVDEETGFVYFGRRYYDPSLGKWLTQDPLGLKAGPNLYAYVLNNPLRMIDQYGLDAVQIENMNQLNGCDSDNTSSSEYAACETYESAYSRNREGDRSSISQDRAQSNRSIFGKMWGGIKEHAPGFINDSLEFADKVSYVMMLVPHPATKVSGAVLKGVSLVGKKIFSKLASSPGREAIKRTIREVFHSNALARRSAAVTENIVRQELKCVHGQKFVDAAKELMWPSPANGRAIVNGIEYTTHALERMAPRGLIQRGTEIISRGVPPSVVENAIKFGTKTSGNTQGFLTRKI